MSASEFNAKGFFEDDRFDTVGLAEPSLTSLSAGSLTSGRRMLHEDIVKLESQSTSTLRKYRQIYDRLVDMYMRSMRKDEFDESYFDTSPHAIVRYMIDRNASGAISFTTAKTYKAALMWMLAQAICPEHPEYEDAWHEINEFKPIKSAAPAKRREGAGGAVSESDLDRLCRSLEDGHNPNTGLEAIAWIKATLATGLRPQEWMQAAWADPEDRTSIRVRSAKKSEEMPPIERLNEASRIAGTRVKSVYDANLILRDKYGCIPPWEPQNPYRTIEVAPELRAAVRTHMALFEAAVHDETEYRRYYDRTRQAILRAAREMPGQPSISLYSFRHQFSSNTKAAAGAAVAAVLLGHEAQADGLQRVTAGYGKARYAHRKVHGQSPRQAAAELDRITPTENVPRGSEGLAEGK
jgi:hypothetical protein